MTSESCAFEAADGFPLAGTVFGTGSQGVLVCGGTGIKRGYYAKVAASLADRGFTVLTFDYRGIGDSRPSDGLRGFEAAMEDWARLDIVAGLNHLRALGVDRIRIVGHSFGGQAIGLLPADALSGVERMVFVSSQSGAWRHWGRRRPIMWLLWHLLMPAPTKMLGWFPGRIVGNMGDLPRGVALQWARWGRHSDYLARDGIPSGFGKVTCPIRAYSFEDDQKFAPRSAVETLLRWYENAAVEHIHLPGPMGHFGFFGRKGEPYWSEIAGWLETGVSASTPSIAAAHVDVG